MKGVTGQQDVLFCGFQNLPGGDQCVPGLGSGSFRACPDHLQVLLRRLCGLSLLCQRAKEVAEVPGGHPCCAQPGKLHGGILAARPPVLEDLALLSSSKGMLQLLELSTGQQCPDGHGYPGTGKKAASEQSTVGTTRALSRNWFICSQLVSAMSKQPWHAAP